MASPFYKFSLSKHISLAFPLVFHAGSQPWAAWQSGSREFPALGSIYLENSEHCGQAGLLQEPTQKQRKRRMGS
jgi:hypothetical protein